MSSHGNGMSSVISSQVNPGYCRPSNHSHAHLTTFGVRGNHRPGGVGVGGDCSLEAALEPGNTHLPLTFFGQTMKPVDAYSSFFGMLFLLILEAVLRSFGDDLILGT